MNGHSCLLKCGNNALACLGRERDVDKHRLCGIADARAARLAVHSQRNRLIHIRFPIHIQVAITRARLNRRHRGIFHHRRNQPSATPRNHHIHQTPGGNQILNTLPSLARQQLHHLAGKTMLRQRFLQDLHQLLVGMPRRLGTPQQRHIPRLQRQTKRIHRHIRAGLIHHAHHPQWNPHLTNPQPISERPTSNNIPHRVRQRRHLAQTIRDAFYALRRQRQTINQRLRQASLPASANIPLIRRHNIRRPRLQRRCGIVEDSILILGGGVC